MINKLLLTLFMGIFLLSCTSNSDNPNNEEATVFDARINALLSKMSIEEKVAQMRMFHAMLGIELDERDSLVLSDKVKEKLKLGIAGIKNPGEHYTPERSAILNNQLQAYILKNGRHGIPAFFVTESYNGVDAEGCTKFGRPINMAATWNLELVNKVYDIVGREARLRGLHLTHSPEADIVRDPRFGRMSEAFSEDTYLTTEMIVSAVKGMQGNTEGLSKTHIGAVTKHFAGYAQVSGGTNFASIEISERTLIDEIFPPFQAAVERANTLGIMASHGDLNGIASHANPKLLTNVLRKQWGFQGYTISDANDIGRLHYFMKVAETPQDASRMALEAGMDVDLYAEDAYALLPDMVKNHPELEKLIDRSARRVLLTKFKLGLFDHPFTNTEDAKTITRNANAVALAHESDLESIILLKNDKALLPLDENKKTRIALVGPLLDKDTKSHFEKETNGKISFVAEKGFNLTNKVKSVPSLSTDSETQKGYNKILNTVKGVDKIILFVGGDEYTAKEAFFNGALGDRDDINPVGRQRELVKALKKTGKPLIVVLKHRRTLSINTIAEEADAILDCWDLSEFGDKALAKMLFGKANPSGKLPVTVPRTIGQLPFHYSQKEINYKKGYLFSDYTPLYPFGFGLSYTTFKYSNLKVSDSTLNKNGTITVSVDVENSGKFKGKEVVQLYLKDLIGSVVRPDKELKGFQKIELAPGEKQTVTFTIEPKILEFTGLSMTKILEAGDYHVLVGGNSKDVLVENFKLVD